MINYYMKLLKNRVFIKIDESNQFVNGLWVDRTYSPGEHAIVRGVLVACGELSYHRDPQHHSSAWDVPCEVLRGDTVYFDYMASIRALGEDTAMKKDTSYFRDDTGARILSIWYNDLIMRIRDGEIYPLNGYVLWQPEKTGIKTILHVPDYLKEKDNKCKGIVKYVGCLVKEYKQPHTDRKGNFLYYESDQDEIQVGDIIYTRPNSSLYIEDTIHGKDEFSRYLYCHRRKIIAKE